MKTIISIAVIDFMIECAYEAWETLAPELLNKLGERIQKRVDAVKVQMGSIQNTKLVRLPIEYLAIVCFSLIVNSFNLAHLINEIRQ